MRVTFLGTGTSRGVPVIGCECDVCRSENPRNRRLRSSVMLERGASRVVIDTSVDFRTQMLREKVRSLDAIVYTHSHVDHILGLDDVYPFNIWSGRSMPIYADESTMDNIRRTFNYLFVQHRYPGIPTVDLIPISGPFQIGELAFQPIEVFHGRLPILGFRVGAFAYITDVSRIPEDSFSRLEGVRFLALDGLRYKSHPTHFSLDEAAAVAARLGCEQTYLIHLCHDVDHDKGNAYLPDRVALAHDGLVWEIEESS